MEDNNKTRHDEVVAQLAAQLADLAVEGEKAINAFAQDIGTFMEQIEREFESSFESRTRGTTPGTNGAPTECEGTANGTAAQHAEPTTSNAADANESKATEAKPADDQSAPTCSEATTEPASTEPATVGPIAYSPQFTPAAQAFRDRMRVGAGSDLMLTDPEFVERFANFAFDDVVTDVDLPDRTRFMCWLATLLGCSGIDEFRALLPAALNVGVEPETIKEIVYQGVAYLGIGRVYPFLKATNDALVAAGITLPLKNQATTLPTEESRYEGGEQAQMACFGEQMRGYKDRGAADYPHIAQWLVKNCFGDWYTRGGLTIAEREMCTFCYIAAQGGCEPQLLAHATANVQCGNDRDFLIKVVSNNVPFIGYPRSLNAMTIVEKATSAE